MRQIKFRGKTAGGEWIFGSLDTSAEEVLIRAHDNSLSFNSKIVIPETIGQFTGTKDQNGIEIYEGDIVLVPYNRIGEITVTYFSGITAFNIGSYVISQLSVVGNIHDRAK